MKLKKIMAVGIALVMAATGISYTAKNTEKVEAADEYELVWSDEFNGTELDTSVWSYETGNGQWGWGNGEVEYYTSREKNVEVTDGYLQIHAVKENYNGYSYTSGRINSKGKKAFTYGKMEARIKVENGNQSGVWPAYWMMGNNYDSVGWPRCGEIDIMEHANSNNTVGGCLHWGISGGTDHGSYGSGDAGLDYVFLDNESNGINGWHTYTLVWDEDHMEWQVDGVTYFQQDITDNNSYCFTKEQFFLFNLAIGGTGTGYTNYQTADADTYQTATMYVDYLRVYQMADQQEAEETTTEKETIKEIEEETVITYETVDSVAESTNVFGTYYAGSGSWAGDATGDSTDATNTGITMNISSVGNSLWGIQTYLSDLEYVAGNTYTYKCTIESDVTKSIYVKVVGDDDNYIFSDDYITVEAGKPYYYETEVTIPSNYTGRLDLYFGLGKNGYDTGLSDTASMIITISDVSFVTEKKIVEVVPYETTGTEETTAVSADETTTAAETVTAPAKARIKKVKAKKVSAKKLKLKIKKTKGATGYQVKVYKTKKKAKKNKKAIVKRNTTKRKVTIKSKKLKNKKKLFVRVRAYALDSNGNKVYGKWSKVKKVKIKK